MKLDELYRMYCSCYFGVREMDEYGSKEFILKEISDFIKEFVKDNPIDDFDYEEEARVVEDTWDLKTKLQDSLIVLPKVIDNIELILMIKNRLNVIREEELEGVI